MRVQWREWKGHLKTPEPGLIKWEDGLDADEAARTVSQLLASEHTPCWIYLERSDVEFKGNSQERPKAKKEKKSK